MTGAVQTTGFSPDEFKLIFDKVELSSSGVSTTSPKVLDYTPPGLTLEALRAEPYAFNIQAGSTLRMGNRLAVGNVIVLDPDQIGGPLPIPGTSNPCQIGGPQLSAPGIGTPGESDGPQLPAPGITNPSDGPQLSTPAITNLYESAGPQLSTTPAITNPSDGPQLSIPAITNPDESDGPQLSAPAITNPCQSGPLLPGTVLDLVQGGRGAGGIIYDITADTNSFYST